MGWKITSLIVSVLFVGCMGESPSAPLQMAEIPEMEVLEAEDDWFTFRVSTSPPTLADSGLVNFRVSWDAWEHEDYGEPVGYRVSVTKTSVGRDTLYKADVPADSLGVRFQLSERVPFGSYWFRVGFLTAVDQWGIQTVPHWSAKQAVPARYVSEPASSHCLPTVSKFRAIPVAQNQNALLWHAPGQVADTTCQYDSFVLSSNRGWRRVEPLVASDSVYQVYDSNAGTNTAYTIKVRQSGSPNRDGAEATTSVENTRRRQSDTTCTEVKCGNAGVEISAWLARGDTTEVVVAWSGQNVRSVRVSGRGVSSTLFVGRDTVAVTRLAYGENRWTISGSGSLNNSTARATATYTRVRPLVTANACSAVNANCSVPGEPWADSVSYSADGRTARVHWATPNGGWGPTRNELTARVTGQRWWACPVMSVNGSYSENCDGHRASSGTSFTAPTSGVYWAVRFGAYAVNSNPSRQVNGWRVNRSGCKGRWDGEECSYSFAYTVVWR